MGLSMIMFCENVLPNGIVIHFLVQAMVNLDMIDTLGMGIRRMFFEQRKRYFPFLNTIWKMLTM